MPRAVWTPFAEFELEEIIVYIAIEDRRPLTAERIYAEIRDKANEFANTPTVGHTHPDMPERMFYFTHKRWIVVYKRHVEGIEVLRVLDGMRDLPNLFGGERTS